MDGIPGQQHWHNSQDTLSLARVLWDNPGATDMRLWSPRAASAQASVGCVSIQPGTLPDPSWITAYPPPAPAL